MPSLSDIDLLTLFRHLCTAVVVHDLDIFDLYAIHGDSAVVFGFAVLLDDCGCLQEFGLVRLLGLEDTMG